MKILIFTSLLFFLSAQLSNAQWMIDSTGMGNKSVTSLQNSGGNIFAGTFSSGVYLSTNNGTSWAQTSFPNNLNVTAFGVNGSNIFAGGYSYGVYRSIDNGGSWTQTSLNNQQVNSLLATGSSIIAGTWGNGIYLSTNNGNNWMQTNINSGTLALTTGGSNIFAGTRENGVYFSTNNGASWSPTALNNGYVNAIEISGNDIFAATTGGIYLSTNNGASWTQVSIMGSILGLAKYSNYIFAGSAGSGVYISTNNGMNWTQRNEGLGNLNVRDLLILNDYLFAATSGSIYRRPLNELIGIQSISTEIPNQFSLGQNFPNPFNPSTKIKFALPKSSSVQLIIYDIPGKEITKLVNEDLNAGTYEYEWNGINLPSGIYFYRLTTDNYSETRKMVLIK